MLVRRHRATALRIRRPNGTTDTVSLICGVNTVDEVAYYRHGGILQYVLRQLKDRA